MSLAVFSPSYSYIVTATLFSRYLGVARWGSSASQTQAVCRLRFSRRIRVFRPRAGSILLWDLTDARESVLARAAGPLRPRDTSEMLELVRVLRDPPRTATSLVPRL